MKSAAIKWFQNVSERQRHCVRGYFMELQKLFPVNQSYYNVPSEALVYCTLYQWEVHEKLMTFGNPNIGLNQNGDAAKITASEVSVDQNVYGSVLVDPTLDALYVWEVLICNQLEERSGAAMLGLGFIGQPNASYTPPSCGTDPFWFRPNSCVNHGYDGLLDGMSRPNVDQLYEFSTSGPWGSRDLVRIVVDTKIKEITWSVGGNADECKPWPSLLKWMAMEFDRHDGEHVYGDDDDDIKHNKFGHSNKNIESDEYFLDWSMPFRLALCMKGNGWFKVNEFHISLEQGM